MIWKSPQHPELKQLLSVVLKTDIPQFAGQSTFPPSLIYIYRSSLCVILSAVNEILHPRLTLHRLCFRCVWVLSFIYYYLRSVTYSLIFHCAFMCISPCFRVWPECVCAVSDLILGLNALYMRLIRLISVPSLAGTCSSQISRERVSDTSCQRCLSSCIQSTGEARALSSEPWKPSLQTLVSQRPLISCHRPSQCRWASLCEDINFLQAASVSGPGTCLWP